MLSIPPLQLNNPVILSSMLRLTVDWLQQSRLLIPFESRSAAAVQKMSALGIEVVMATGDQVTTANSIAESCGIKQVYAELSPIDKLELVKTIAAKWGTCRDGRRRYQRCSRAGSG